VLAVAPPETSEADALHHDIHIRASLQTHERFEDADALAAFFLEHGFIGEQGRHAHCPLAGYRTGTTGFPFVKLPCRNSTLVMDDGRVDRHVPNPAVVKEFVGRCDPGCYPDRTVSRENAPW
jgi:hypothetical protein